MLAKLYNAVEMPARDVTGGPWYRDRKYNNTIIENARSSYATSPLVVKYTTQPCFSTMCNASYKYVTTQLLNMNTIN
jgi:hypothetical protein